MGLAPKDYDIATDAVPKRVRELFRKTQAVGQSFGVILVRHGSSVIEVATFRNDGVYADGRRPTSVVFSTPEEDAQRRDFTCNALFMDPLDGGKVIDHVGGQTDLSNHLLRAVGNPKLRFAEDHLRMLRAARFAARFNFEIERSTRDAIAHDAHLLQRISPERIADELRLMLTPPTRQRAWDLLWSLGLAPTIFRKSDFPTPTDNSTAYFQNVESGNPISFALALSAGCVDIALRSGLSIYSAITPEAARRYAQSFRRTLRISNDELDGFDGIFEELFVLLSDRPATLARLMRFVAKPVFADVVRILRTLLGLGIEAGKITQILDRLAAINPADCSPTPLLNGDELMLAGMAPGPKFKLILEQVYDAQLEGKVADKTQAMEMGRKLYLDL